MSKPRPRRIASLLLCAITLPACGGGRTIGVSLPVPTSVVAESRTISTTIPARPGQLTTVQLEAVAPLITAIRADPVEVLVSVGDTVRIADHVRILALDSLEVVLGELPFYDFAFAGRGFRLLSDGRVHVRRRGSIVFTARLPAAHWRRDPSLRPSTRVRLLVDDGVR